MTRPRRSVRLAAPVALIAMLLVAGCAGPPAGDGYNQLRQAARVETPAPCSVAVPAGLDPEFVTYSPDPERRLGLDAVLSDRNDPLGDSPVVPEIEPDDRTAALRAYLRGREAMLGGRYITASRLLGDAAVLDPTSPSIHRALARTWAVLGERGRELQAHRDTVRLDPGDRDARLAIALQSIERGDDSAALDWIAPVVLADRPDDVTLRIASFAAHLALRELAYDAASIEALDRAVAMPFPMVTDGRGSSRLNALLRRRPEMYRNVGDSALRLGRTEEAVRAYDTAQNALVDVSPPLLLRRVYARLLDGRPNAAAIVLLDGLRDDADVEPDLSRLVAEQLGRRGGAYRDALDSLAAESTAGGAVIAHLTAVAPNRAVRRLEAMVEADPANDAAWMLLLDSLAGQPDELMTAAARAVRCVPFVAEDLVDRVLMGHPRPLAWATRDQASASPDEAALRVRLLVRYWSDGRAWSLVTDALERWPGDLELRRLAVEIAGRLDDGVLLDRALAAVADEGDAWTAIVCARALLVTDRVDEARRAVEAAVESAPDGVLRYFALVESARIAFLAADPLPRGAARAQAIDEGRKLAVAALDIAGGRDEAFELLLTRFGRGIDANPEAFRAIVTRLQFDAPASDASRELDVQRALSSEQPVEAARLLRELLDTRPYTSARIGQFLSAHDAAGTPDVADAWAAAARAEHPEHPHLNERIVQRAVTTGNASTELDRLRQRFESDPDDAMALALLELAASLTNDGAAALEYGERRLRERPPSARRALQLASLYIGADRPLDALREFAALAEAPDARMRHTTMAIGLAGRLGDRPERDEAVAALVEAASRTDEPVPVAIYARGLASLSRANVDAARLRAMMERAASTARGADDVTLQGVRPWSFLAQRLVDEGYPQVAAAAVRERIASRSVFESDAIAVMTAIVIAADSITEPADVAAAATLETLLGLRQRGLLDAIIVPGPESGLADALLWASQIYAAVGNYAGADAILVAALEVDPDKPMVKNNLGYLRLERGRSDLETRQLIEEAATALPEDANVADTVGWLRYLEGMIDDGPDRIGAVSWLARSVELADEPSAEGLDHYGDALWRAGRTEEAVDYWTEAAALLEERRADQVALYARLQQLWGLRVQDPEEMYNRDFGSLVERLRRKLESVREGVDPPIAPTFADVDQDVAD